VLAERESLLGSGRRAELHAEGIAHTAE
jgi:hypothetical protein